MAFHPDLDSFILDFSDEEYEKYQSTPFVGDGPPGDDCHRDMVSQFGAGYTWKEFSAWLQAHLDS